MLKPWPWPPRPDLHVVLLVLHAQEGADFFSDTRLALVGGDLERRGIAAELVHVHYRRGDDTLNGDLDRQLAALVDEQTVVVIDQAWRESLLQGLQARGALLVATDPEALWLGGEFAAMVKHFNTYRAPLVELLAALQSGKPSGPLTNVWLQQRPGEPLTAAGPEQGYPAEPEALQGFAPLALVRRLGTAQNLDGGVPPRRRSLEVSTGCPFAAPVANHPQFSGVELGPTTTLQGCTFCFMGGDYRSPPVAESVRLQVAQLRFWQEHGDGIDEAVLRDQSALRYLPQLIEACQRAGLRPLGLLVPGRGDAILRWGKELRRAAELCGDSGWWFTLHLIGFESFSERQLDLYNKGVSAGDYAEALVQMRALHRQHPQGFRLYAYGASSFILFNPWTELRDLLETAEFCDEHALGALAHGLTLSRLRLYPNLPLYWKAKHDGLLDPSANPAGGAASAGYSREAGWRYREPRVEVVEQLQAQLAELVQPEEAVGLLRAVLAWVQERWPEAAAEPGELSSELQSIAEAFRELRRVWRPDRADPTEARLVAPRPTSEARQRTVSAGRHCNNQCRTCLGHHAKFDDDPGRVAAQIRLAAETGRVVLNGREPALVPQLLSHIRLAHTAGATAVELLSNGRFLASEGAVARLGRAGATRVTVKRHRLADADEDHYVRAAGAGAQGAAGLDALAAGARAQGPIRASVLLIPVREGWGELVALVDWATDRGAGEVRVQVCAGELPLGRLTAVSQALATAQQRAEQRGLAWRVTGF